jgi:hypothetical protein
MRARPSPLPLWAASLPPGVRRPLAPAAAHCLIPAVKTTAQAFGGARFIAYAGCRRNRKKPQFFFGAPPAQRLQPVNGHGSEASDKCARPVGREHHASSGGAGFIGYAGCRRKRRKPQFFLTRPRATAQPVNCQWSGSIRQERWTGQRSSARGSGERRGRHRSLFCSISGAFAKATAIAVPWAFAEPPGLTFGRHPRSAVGSAR